MKTLDEAIREFLGGAIVDAIYKNEGSGAARPELVKKAALNIFLAEGITERFINEHRDIIREALADLTQYGLFNYLPDEEPKKKVVEHKIPSPMTEKDKMFLAKLLGLAAEHTSRHVCNDLPKELREFYTDDEWRQLTKEFHEWNGDPEEFEECPDHFMHNDGCLMDFFAVKLIQKAKVE